jgi:hypothetical protein
MSIFDLAEVQLRKEGKDVKDNMLELLDRAVAIRRWLDKHGTKTAIQIMQGAKIYRYGNKIKTYFAKI